MAKGSPRIAFSPLAAALRIFGLLLLILPFLPTRRLYGAAHDWRGLYDPYQWFLGTLIVLLISAVVAQGLAGPAGRLIGVVRDKLFGLNRILFLLLALGSLAAILIRISAGVFAFRPLLVDDIVQLFQAKIFAVGLIKAPAPALPEFFLTQHMIIDSGGWYSQYPPGHSAALALGLLAGAPWLVPVIMSLVSAYAFYRFTAEAYDEGTARLSLLALIASPFFLFMGASFMNHVSALCFISLALWTFARFEKTGSAGMLATVGVFLGAAFMSRPLCALSAGIVFALWGAPAIIRERRYGAALCGLLGFAALACLMPLYNKLTTGDPFLPGYIKLWGESHGLGFHVSPWGELHSPKAGLAKQIINLSILNEYLFETCVPGCIFMALLFVLPGDRLRWDRRLVLLFIAFPAMYFFYWHRDSYLGPRFIYVSLLAAIPLTVRGVISTLAFLKSAEGIPGGLKPVQTFGFATAAFFAYGALVGFPSKFQLYASGMESMKVNLTEEAKRAGIDSGLIFIPVSWGSRLLSELRTIGISAAEAEQAYRTSDHCQLFQLAQTAKRTSMPVEVIEAQLKKLKRERVQKFSNINGDGTLRLRPAIKPADECIREIEYDNQGIPVYTPGRRPYSVFLPHLLEDDPRLTPPFVFATDMRSENRKLMRQYPGLQPYLYRAGRFIKLTAEP